MNQEELDATHHRALFSHYVVCTASTADELAALVSEMYYKKGYIPQGGVSVSQTLIWPTIFAQAMVPEPQY